MDAEPGPAFVGTHDAVMGTMAVGAFDVDIDPETDEIVQPEEPLRAHAVRENTNRTLRATARIASSEQFAH